MGGRAIVRALVLSMGTAHADLSSSDLYDRLWPQAPVRGGLTMGEQLTDSLPDFEMAPAEYRGDRGVEIRLPLFKHEF